MKYSSLINGWNVMRTLRLALGILILLQGIQTGSWVFIVSGTVFSLMPLFNIGGCSPRGCNTHPSQNIKQLKDTTYEEVL